MAGDRYFEDRMTVKDVAVGGKRVLVRVDFNVPLGKDGTVEDDFRIVSALPTIKHILAEGGRPILISHLGRPKGKRRPELSLRPVGKVLEGHLRVKVHMAPDCTGDEVEELVEALPEGEVLLLENSRFHPGEESNDPDFARQLSRLADLYVNDAFGTAHRAHASTEGVTHFLKPAVAGFLIEKELRFLGGLISGPAKPFVAIIGGAKISGKIEVLKNLLDRVDGLVVGGGIANTFLKAGGCDIGASLFEEDSLEVARDIVDLARTKGVDIALPEDFVIADEVREGATIGYAEKGQAVQRGFSIVDIGPRSVVRIIEVIGKASTIFWNGPVGVFEVEEFAHGTFEVARSVAAASQGGAISVIGGGDTASAVSKAGVRDKVTHISTGGGASLEFIEGRELPGIAALTRKGEG
jgi:phosphoglycerate kinase